MTAPQQPPRSPSQRDLPHLTNAGRREPERRSDDAKRWIVDLADIRQHDSPQRMRQLARRMGGKALNLGRMMAWGLPVPPAFVVSTEAFEDALDHMFAGAGSLRSAAALLRPPALPPALVEVIVGAYRRLGPDQPVAVRSSASDEDGSQRSFAGQQASVLNVCGEAALLEALCTVWASLFATESLLYRSRERLDGPVPRMAVIVQRFVPAEVAGVLFTQDPTSSDSGLACVSAAYGVGEMVVGGRDSDTFYLERKTRSLRRDVVAKAQRLQPRADSGLELAAVPEALQHEASLSDARLQRLLDLGIELERYFGEPLDIEFAYGPERQGRDDGLVILQARPITARPGGRSSTGHRATVYSNVNVGEALPGVGTPLTWSIIHSFARGGFESAFGALGLQVPESYGLIASFSGRVYLNLSEFMAIASQIPLLTPEMLGKLGGVPRVSGLEATYSRGKPGRFLRQLPLTLGRLGYSQFAMPLIGERWSRRFALRREAFFARELRVVEDAGLLDLLDEVDAVFDRTGDVMLACASNFLVSYAAVSEALKLLGGPAAARKETRLFAGLTNVRSAAPGLELLELARAVRSSPELRALFARDGNGHQGKELVGTYEAHGSGAHRAWSDALLASLRASVEGRDFLQQLEGFLRRWGGRALREAELATPRWREDPSFLLAVLQRHVLGPELPTAESIEAEQRALRAEATQLVRQHFVTGVGTAFRALLRWTQTNARRRELLRADVVDTLSMYRAVFLELGRRFAARGVLAQADDVFFLSDPELRGWLEAKAARSSARRDLAHSVAPEILERSARRLVAYRRALFQAFVESPDPPDTFTLTLDKQLPQAPSLAPGASSIQGLPGSAGIVTGPARVLLELPPGPIPIKRGEILVTGFTDVGWTPLFLVAGGVVTDRGGPLSHSCVVAREYGIPAVAGAFGATQLIKTGDIVRVDGSLGTVQLLLPRGGNGNEAKPASGAPPSSVQR